MPGAGTAVTPYFHHTGDKHIMEYQGNNARPLPHLESLCDITLPHSYRGEDVVQTLERVCCDVGYPKIIRVDNGSEFISRDLDLWADANDVVLDFSRPGKPTDNAFIESFNGSFRAERLNTHWFMSLDDAREKMED